MPQNSTENFISKLKAATKQRPKREFELRAEMLISNRYEMRKIVEGAILTGVPVMRSADEWAYYIGNDEDGKKIASQLILDAYEKLRGAQRLMKIPEKAQITMTALEKIVGVEFL